MKIITIMMSDDAEPSCVYIGEVEPRAAYHACWKAAEAIDELIEGFVVDRTLPTDWSASP